MSSAADVWHRWHKRAGLQDPRCDHWRIVALQRESMSQELFLHFLPTAGRGCELSSALSSVSPRLSPQVMKWFWAVVSCFTQEELARLLQFTTGSSQLPPGGFNTLCPSFQIIAAPTHSTLPTAHTWWVGTLKGGGSRLWGPTCRSVHPDWSKQQQLLDWNFLLTF